MILQALNLSASAGPYLAWAVENREVLKNVPTETADFLVSVIASGGDAIERVGSQLVFGSPSGARSVIGFVDQATPQLNHIETAVNGLEVGQVALSSSLASLQTVSMVTLGVSAIAPILLASQFRYLSGRFDEVKKSLVELKQMQYEKVIAALDSGLHSLETGIEKENPALVEDALIPCREAMSFFSGQLSKALESGNSPPQFLNYIARHLAVSMCATARTHIGLGYDSVAREVLEKNQPLLRQTSKHIFNETVGVDPAKYLIPELAEDISYDFIRSIYKQAEAANILPEELAASLSGDPSKFAPEGFFETIRPSLLPTWKSQTASPACSFSLTKLKRMEPEPPRQCLN